MKEHVLQDCGVSVSDQDFLVYLGFFDHTRSVRVILNINIKISYIYKNNSFFNFAD